MARFESGKKLVKEIASSNSYFENLVDKIFKKKIFKLKMKIISTFRSESYFCSVSPLHQGF